VLACFHHVGGTGSGVARDLVALGLAVELSKE
jgi:hypothetical protein